MTCNPSDVTVERNSATVREAEALDAKSVELGSDSALDNTYTYAKTLKLTFNGRRAADVDGKRFIIEDEKGDCYLLEEEFGDSVTWKYTLSDTEDSTEWTVSMDANLQVLPCEVTSVGTYDDCGYTDRNKPKVAVYAKASSLFSEDNFLIITDAKTSLEGNVTYTETYDGVAYEDSVQVVMPLEGADIEKSMDLQAFMKYRHIASVTKGTGAFVIGTEHGADCRSVISAASEEGEGSLTLIFSTVTDRMAPWVSPFEVSVLPSEEFFYDYVKYAHDGTEGFICNGDGTAQYILQRGYYQDGTATELYKAMNGYAKRFPSLQITGVFYGTKTFPNRDCVVYNVLSTTFPSSITFNTTTRSFTGKVYSELSEWEVISKPSFVTVTPDHGDTGTTDVTIALANTQHSYMTGSIIFSNVTMTQVVTVTYNAGQVIPDPATHDASGFTVKLRANSNYPVTLVSSPEGITTTKYSSSPPKWQAAIPNNNTTSDRTFTWRFSTGTVTQNVTVEQKGCFEQWKTTGGYICDEGDSYVKEIRLVSYDGITWRPSGERRKGDLLEADAPYCEI